MGDCIREWNNCLEHLQYLVFNVFFLTISGGSNYIRLHQANDNNCNHDENDDDCIHPNRPYTVILSYCLQYFQHFSLTLKVIYIFVFFRWVTIFTVICVRTEKICKYPRQVVLKVIHIFQENRLHYFFQFKVSSCSNNA